MDGRRVGRGPPEAVEQGGAPADEEIPPPAGHGAAMTPAPGAPRVALGRPASQRQAVFRERAGHAEGPPRRADELAQIHQRGGQPSGRPGRKQLPRVEEDRRAVLLLPGCSANGEQSGKDPRHVGVRGRMAASESEAGHGRGGVFAEAGQPGERREIAGEDSSVVPRDAHGRAAEVAGPRVIAQARPGREDALLPGAGERRKVREPIQERTVPLPDRRDRRLLEHDLGDPDAIRIGRAPPGKGSLFSRTSRSFGWAGRDFQGFQKSVVSEPEPNRLSETEN